MKKNLKSGRRRSLSLGVVAWGLVLGCVLFMSACQSPSREHTDKQKAEVTYYCPMHPEVQQSMPGVCNKCDGMELVIKPPEGLLVDVLPAANAVVMTDVKTVHPIDTEIAITVNAEGLIAYDERTKHTIAAQIGGRIEKLYIKYNYQMVHKGQKIMELYSPELVTAQQNLVYLLTQDKGAANMLLAARQKLQLLGMTQRQIDQLGNTKSVQYSVPVYSASSGRIMETQDNSRRSVALEATAPLLTKEGMYISAGQTVFNLTDPKLLVVYLQIKQQDAAKVKEGQKVSLVVSGADNSKREAVVNLVEPYVKGSNKTLLARVDIDNADNVLKVGTLVSGTIYCSPSDGLWVPASAVVDMGQKRIVWVKKNNHFVATRIEVGAITDEWVEIYDGITKRDEIAAEAHYLADSEGFIKTTQNEDETK